MTDEEKKNRGQSIIVTKLKRVMSLAKNTKKALLLVKGTAFSV